MKKFNPALFYGIVIGIFTTLMYLIVITGKNLEAGRDIVLHDSHTTGWNDFTSSLVTNIQSPIALLLLQIVVILMTARLFGWLFQQIGQPSVMGEIIAGIVLGPSLIGKFFPEFSAVLFPASSLGSLKFLSHIGLILFMFIVGMELNLNVLRTKAHEAVVISHASIVIPFTLGMGLAYFMYASFAPPSVEFLPFALFIGIAMSITAFPVLARIVQERKLQHTRVGSVAITCAAVDDISAWCILAAVIAVAKSGSFVGSVYTIGFALAYIFIMLKVVKPFLQRMARITGADGEISKQMVAVFLLTLIVSCYATEIIGIHALFGAFMVGVIMPENMGFRNVFIQKTEDVAVILLLPLFFVFSGLRTQVGLLNDPHLWMVTGIIILIAVAGKFIGSALTARLVGQSWRDSLMIGALMNTRGLMELVALNIGYDLGLLTPEVFTMMVIMALVTTFMTGPALTLTQRFVPAKEEEELSAA